MPGLLAKSWDTESARVWQDNTGAKSVRARLVAAGRERATLQLEDGSKVLITLKSLSEEDREYVLGWREDYPEAPMVDMDAMQPWPARAGSGIAAVKSESADPASGKFQYRSAHFILRSDLDLPLRVVQEMATVFEATHDAVYRVPLNLAEEPAHSRREFFRKFRGASAFDRDNLVVDFFKDPQSYTLAGGPAGSGGYYATWQGRTLISLSNLGIEEADGGLDFDYRQKLFVLKHEIVHHLMHPWLGSLPVWFREGICEYFAAAPLVDGYYSFDNLDPHMLDYLNKWRYNEDPDTIPMIHPERLMAISTPEWEESLKNMSPVLNYNSAALLAYYFLTQDGKGDGAPVAAYLDAIRRGIGEDEASSRYLLRGRTHEQIAADIQKAWRLRSITIAITPSGGSLFGD